MARNKRLYFTIISLLITSIVAYLFLKLIGAKSFFAFKMILKIRIPKLVAIITAGSLVTIASLVFQTIVNNRILTPSMLGFDAIYIGVQTIIVFLFGSLSLFMLPIYNFLISAGVMVGVTLLIYRLVLRRSKNNVIILLLVGLVITTLINSAVSFMQSLMSPDEFLNLASSTNVSLVNMNLDIIIISVPLMIFCIILFYKDAYKLEILSLGEDNAINLGLNYNREVNKHLIYIAISMSIATSLVGPLSFLGLIIVNLTREFFKTNNFKVLIVFSSVIAIIFLLLGMTLLEALGHITTLQVIIILIGGIYLFYLIIKENAL